MTDGKHCGAAANRVFGGGILDDTFLKPLTALIGDHDEITYETPTSRDGQTSTSSNSRKTNTFDVSELASLPEWRAIVFNSKSRPVLVKTVPWFRDKSLRTAVNEPLHEQAVPTAARSNNE